MPIWPCKRVSGLHLKLILAHVTYAHSKMHLLHVPTSDFISASFTQVAVLPSPLPDARPCHVSVHFSFSTPSGALLSL